MTDEPPTHPTEPDSSEAGTPEPGAPEAGSSGSPDTVAAVDPLDERLSAALDGESAPEEIATDDEYAADRRRALADARDLLAVPPPPLDDITRRRLLRAALAVRPQGKSRDLKRLNQIGAAAAVLAVVVAGGLAINAIGHSANKNSKASSGAGSATQGTTAPDLAGPKAAPLDLRDVSDPQVLKQRVAAALGEQDRATTSEGATATTQPQRSSNSGGADAGNRCLSAITVSKGSTPPRVLADATYKGAPAVVAIASNPSGTAVYVLATGDCRLLTYQFLKR